MILTLVGLLFSLQSTPSTFADPVDISLGDVLDDNASQKLADIDVHYLSFEPVFEENQDPAKSVRIEFYLAEDDQTPQSQKRIQWIRSQMKHDLKENPGIATSYEAFGASGDAAEGNPQVDAFWKQMGVRSERVSYESIPSEVQLQIKNPDSQAMHSKGLSRKPAAGLGRNFWTMIRFTSSFGASFLGLKYGFHVEPVAAILASIFPALGSASVTYFSPQVGRYLVSKAWSEAIVNGSNPFTRKLQKLLKLDAASLAAMPEAQRLQVVGRLHGTEEGIRWYLTELVFTLGLIKIPQRIAQITQEGLGRVALIGVTGSIKGFLAQGAGDLAVSKRKIQKFEELRSALISGEINHPDRARIIQELNEILDPAIARNADTTVHPMIQRIENWARSRGVALSFISVAGVVLDTVGVPISSILLVGLGVTGATYYAKVNGWFAPESRLSVGYQNTKARIGKFFSKFLSLPQRVCKDDFTDIGPPDELSLEEFGNMRERFIADLIPLHQHFVL